MISKQLFSVLSKEDKQYLEENSVQRTYAKNELVFAEKSKTTGFYLVRSGTVKRFISGIDGKECIFDVCGYGEVFGHRTVISNTEHFDSSVAITQAELTFIPSKIFHELLTKYAAIKDAFIEILTLDSIKHIRHSQIISQLSLRQRTAYYLLYIANKNPIHQKYVEISREDFANLIGTVKESAVRALHDFKTDHVIISTGRKIELLQPEELRKAAKVEVATAPVI